MRSVAIQPFDKPEMARRLEKSRYLKSNDIWLAFNRIFQKVFKILKKQLLLINLDSIKRSESLIYRYYDDYIHRALKTMTAYNIVIEILNKEMLSMNDKVVETLANEIYKIVKRFERERLAGRNDTL